MNHLKKAAANLREELKRLRDSAARENSLLREFLQYGNIRTLNRSLLAALVDVIYVYENHEITIKFRFEDELLRAAERDK